MASRHKQGKGHNEFSYVNPRHHSSCLAGSDTEDLTLTISRRPPDPFYVPAAAQPYLKVKEANISEENVINLCRSARVYFNSYNKAQTRGKLKKRFEEVSSPRKVQQTDRKLIPLEGYEDEASREERKSHRNSNDANERREENTAKHSGEGLSHRGSRSSEKRSHGSKKQNNTKE